MIAMPTGSPGKRIVVEIAEDLSPAANWPFRVVNHLLLAHQVALVTFAVVYDQGSDRFAGYASTKRKSAAPDSSARPPCSQVPSGTPCASPAAGAPSLVVRPRELLADHLRSRRSRVW